MLAPLERRAETEHNTARSGDESYATLLGRLWILSTALVDAPSGSTDERLSTPQSAVDNFLKWQLPPAVNMDIVSEAMGINPSMSADRRRELTRELKAVLDARGLLVHVDAIPADPDYVDESSGQRRHLGMRRYRRIKEVLNPTYSTTAQQMQAFVEGVRTMIQANGYMSLEILRLAEELAVEFAFPTQTVHVDSFYGDEPRVVGKNRSSEELTETVASFGSDGGMSRPHGLEVMLDGKKLDDSPHGATTGSVE